MMQTQPPIELREPEQVYRAALLLHRQGRLAEAERLYRAAIEAEPGHVLALYNLGLIRLLGGDIAAAIGLIGQALNGRPDFAEGHNALAIALRAQGRIAEAIGHFEQAIAIAPDMAEPHNNYAATLLMANRFDAAARHYERALALKPDMAEAYHGYGNLLTIFGRTEAARRAIETAIDLMPKRAEFYRSLGEIKQFRVSDRQIAMVEALAREADRLPEDDRIHLDFALGKVYADLGQHERAFRHLLDGNARKRKQTDYDERAVQERFALTRELFSAEVMVERAGLGDPSPLPVFIIGMPRSGTTLVEQILAAHPQVHGGGERGDFEASIAELDRGEGTAPDVGGAELRQIGSRYLDRVRALAPQAAARITDKMPGNFRFAGLIHLALPNARIIHVRRDPVDTCFSCFSILFGGDQPYSYDLGELGRFYRGYAELMAHWRAVLPAGVMLEVQYETLVADFEPQARRIVTHCGLDWSDACLAFHQAKRPVRTASSAQVRRPLYRSSIGRWRPYKKMLRPLLAALDGAASLSV
jgi:tetratricopeptide (TPR) repeat protein